MCKEIERKFLVNGQFRHMVSEEKQILQGYLSVDQNRIVRLRITDSQAVLSIKSPVGNTGISRHEWEFKIPLKEAAEIMKVCLPEIIKKTRFIVPYGGHIFEVDQFHGKNEGLVIAEVELKDENEIFEKPDWLGEEVTGRPEYYNSNLI